MFGRWKTSRYRKIYIWPCYAFITYVYDLIKGLPAFLSSISCSRSTYCITIDIFLAFCQENLSKISSWGQNQGRRFSRPDPRVPETIKVWNNHRRGPRMKVDFESELRQHKGCCGKQSGLLVWAIKIPIKAYRKCISLFDKRVWKQPLLFFDKRSFSTS